MADRSPRCVSGFMSFGGKSSSRRKCRGESLFLSKLSCNVDCSTPDTSLTKQQQRHDRDLDKRMEELTSKIKQQLRPTSPEQREKQVNEIINYSETSSSPRTPRRRPQQPLRHCQRSQQQRPQPQRQRSQPVDLDAVSVSDDLSVSADILSIATAGWSSQDGKEKICSSSSCKSQHSDDSTIAMGSRKMGPKKKEVLKLTRDGLQKHNDRSSSSTTLKEDRRQEIQAVGEAYSAWKRHHEKRLQRKKMAAFKKNPPPPPPPPEHRDASYPSERSPFGFFLKKQQREDNNVVATTTTNVVARPMSPAKKRLINPINLLKKSSPSAQEILEQEQARELEDRVKQREEEFRERQRIARLRQKALARQRKLEGLKEKEKEEPLCLPQPTSGGGKCRKKEVARGSKSQLQPPRLLSRRQQQVVVATTKRHGPDNALSQKSRSLTSLSSSCSSRGRKMLSSSRSLSSSKRFINLAPMVLLEKDDVEDDNDTNCTIEHGNVEVVMLHAH